MKALKSIKILTSFVCSLSITVIFSSAMAQEYDDMYFNKSDRKTVKVDKATVLSSKKNQSNTNYKEISKSTETYSAKNVNPEYVARYKSTESNQVTEVQKDDTYNSNDYFVEGYDKSEYVSDVNKNDIDYVALNKRDQMSYSNYNKSFSSPSWRFSPYMSMGMGMGSPYGGYGYDPFMMGMGYGSGMTMGMRFGSGFGYSPFMSYNIGMSYGTGYNPWGGGYPGYYSPYGRRGFYDPWGSSSMYGYNPYNSIGCSPYYGGYGSGGYGSALVATSYGSDALNGRKINYKPRTTRVTSDQRNISRTNSDNLRVSSADAKIRVADRNISSTASNGRVSKDYSKVQNEYYNNARRNSSSTNRISSSNRTRNTYSRSSNTASKYASSINNNKPTRSSGISSGYNRSNYNKSSSGYSRSSSSNSFSSPSRSSSYSSGSSGSRSSSYSSGRSSSGSSSGSSRSSSSSSRSGRQ